MNDAKRIVEALLLVADKFLMVNQVKEVLGNEWNERSIRQLFQELIEEYDRSNRGIRIVEIAEGFQYVTDPALAAFVTKLTQRVKSVKLSKQAMETLAIIAYRQPLTRIEIEQVRGVDSSGVLETLLKLNLIQVAGRKEVVGRPLLYETTREFLDHFGLKNLENLPTLEELKSLSQQAVQKTSTAESDSQTVPLIQESNELNHELNPTPETN